MARGRELIEKIFPDCEHSTHSSIGTYLSKINGKFVTGDTCNTTRKVGRDICTRIYEFSEEMNMSCVFNNGKLIKTAAKPCHNHQMNVCLDAVSK